MAKKKKPNVKKTRYYLYAKDVVEGKIVAGELVKLACQRFLDDLEREDLFFDAERVEKAFQFVGILKHFKNDFAGKNFELTDIQQFIFANIIGFFYVESGQRRYRQSYIQVARKFGKTALASALSLYFLIADGIASPSIAFCGASRDQSAIAFDFAQKWCMQLDPNGKDIRILRNEIKVNINNGRMKVYSSDVKSGIEGGQFDFSIVDEYHTHPNSIVYDSVKGGMIGSKAHLAVITTAGFNLESPCYAMRNSCIDTLHNINPNDRMFALIFEMDEGDDWQDESVWKKCQPNLGVTCSYEFMRSQAESAKSNPTETVSVMTKNWNIWMRTSEVWIPDTYIVRSMKKLEFEDFRGELCYVGLDLASVSDFCALSFCFKKEDKYFIKTLYYLPEEALITSPNRELYKQWVREHYLTVTNGNVCDYDYILNDLQKIRSTVSIGKILYDKYNSTQFIISGLEVGLPFEEYGQSLANFNKPTKEMQRLILSHKVVLDSNPINLYCFRNVAIKQDHNENIKPYKSSLNNKIDGVISSIQSLAPWVEQRVFDGNLLIL